MQNKWRFIETLNVRSAAEHKNTACDTKQFMTSILIKDPITMTIFHFIIVLIWL